MSLVGPCSTRLLGTPLYMAPERFTLSGAVEASDWYSIGVMLYQALSGQLPWSEEELVMQHPGGRPAPVHPDSVSPGIPAELAHLSLDLLRANPDERPRAQEILHRLGWRSLPEATTEPMRASNVASVPHPFGGRTAELVVLRDAFAESERGETAVVEVCGPSGIGKTALMREFLRRLADEPMQDIVILDGRCYEQESVAFKVFDGVVDALAQHLASLPTGQVRALLPRNVHELTQLFPTMLTVEAVTSARRRVFDRSDGLDLRRKGFEALRELLGRLAHDKPVVVFVDDLQWGDSDSVSLLRHLLCPPDAPPLLLLVAWRTEYADDPTLRELRAVLVSRPTVPHTIVVEPLKPDETRLLAAMHLGENHPSIDDVAREAAGWPYFIDELAGRANADACQPPRLACSTVRLRLDDVLWARIDRLPPHARRLLEILAIAAKPLERRVARDAADLEEEDAEALLCQSHLARVSLAGRGLETFHDRIREVVQRRMPEHRRRELHQRLAGALENTENADPEDLAIHHHGAGDVQRAAHLAAAAADRAAKAAAFARATRLYRWAIDLKGPHQVDTSDLLARLGEAQANAGRGREAAESFLIAAERDPDRAQDLRRRTSEQLLRVGDIDLALAVMRNLFHGDTWGMPKGLLGLLASALLCRARSRLRGLAFRPRLESEIPHDLLLRTDMSWAAFVGMFLLDPVRANYVESHHMMCALRAGEPVRVARALAVEATFILAAGKSRLPRHERLRAALDGTLATVSSPMIRGLVGLTKTGAAFFLARWADSVREGVAAERVLLEECATSPWELALTRALVLSALISRGELGECMRRLPDQMRDARERGDRFAQTALLTLGSSHVVRLAENNPELAAAEIADLRAQWSAKRFPALQFGTQFGLAQIALYEGQAAKAWGQFADGTPALLRLMLHATQTSRIAFLHLRARAALALALENASMRRSLIRRASADARALAAEREPWSDGFAALIRAAIASMTNDRSAAISELATAEARLATADMWLFANTARWLHGAMLPASQGLALIRSAEDWMKAQGVRKPERIIATYGAGHKIS